ncbi:MAG: ABC transporter permease [Bacteroidota bacterium]
MLRVVRALWQREILKFLRDRARLVGALVQPLVFWLLLGFGFYDSFQMPGSENVSYLEYLFPGIVALILLFTAIFSTIYIVDERQTGLLQAALVAPVSRLSLVLGNLAGGVTLALAEALLFLLLAPLVGLTPTFLGLLVIVLACLSMAMAFTALGFTIAWRLDTTRGFHAIMNLVLLPMWFLSGAFFPPEGVPVAVRWVMYVNPAFYGVAALRDGLYLPEAAPSAAGLPTGLALGLSIAFATAMVGLAVWTVQRRSTLTA